MTYEFGAKDTWNYWWIEPKTGFEMTALEVIQARLQKDLTFSEGRRELFQAALNYGENFLESADAERMVSVIARLEVAADKFVAAKQEAAR